MDTLDYSKYITAKTFNVLPVGIASVFLVFIVFVDESSRNYTFFFFFFNVTEINVKCGSNGAQLLKNKIERCT